MPKISPLIFFISALFFAVSCSSPKEEKPEPKVVNTKSDESFSMPDLPTEMEFGGQKIKIDNFDIQERLDKELIVNTFYHSSTIQYFKRSNRFFPTIERIMKEEGVPDDFKYLCLIESGLTQAVSPSGAKGFWQFMPATGKEYDLRIDSEVDERLNVEKSTRAACQYLKDANSKFNDWLLTSAAYNRGVGGITKDLERQRVDDYLDLHLNNETSRYMFRILALKLIFENAEDYGFYKDNMSLYDPIQTRSIGVEESIDNLMSWAVENGSNYHMLKILNPWIRSDKLTFKSAPYTILLPL
ncbi:MAG: lytic transglycosylase domain-containing protein [Crocinitomicaceae bacterium]